MSELIDPYGRRINYLRISITDRCNLRCRYCVPEGGLKCIKPRSGLLSFEEMISLTSILAEEGIERVKITGGEPLTKKSITTLINGLAAIKGIKDLSITTNGLLLADQAGLLKAAGLSRVNISLDSLDGEKYSRLTRGGDLSAVLKGLKVALEAGFDPIKINVVLMKGINDGLADLAAFLEFIKERPIHLRFIEFMTLGDGVDPEFFIPSSVIIERVRSLASLVQIESPAGGGPARYFGVKGARGTVGFISAMSDPFCAECNRIRLLATGALKTCLFTPEEIDIIGPLRNGASDEEMKRILKDVLAGKPKDRLGGQGEDFKWRMSEIGG
ncbi:MAG: GTP 3',8-cyclase MoaA [Actinomycetota bacterium]|nr:GTP 3',8-cyclase MoaA [Actinomycetota bacterium]